MNLKPCPFCGRIPTEDDVVFYDGEGCSCDLDLSERAAIYCECGCCYSIDSICYIVDGEQVLVD